MNKDDRSTPQSKSNAHRMIRFGAFEVDVHTQELWKYGVRLKLAGQPFQVLEMLLARPGELVARDELQKRLWPDAPFTDSNHGLNAAVNKLREMLGDSADDPKFIETLPRRGYRFIGTIETEDYLQSAEPVAAMQPAEASAACAPDELVAMPTESAETALRGAPRPASRWLARAASFGILLCGIGVVGFVGKSLLTSRSENASEAMSEETRELVRANPVPLVERVEEQLRKRRMETRGPVPIDQEQHAIVPVPAVYRTVGTLEPTTRTIISGEGGAAGPQFSPDGKRIAFMSNRTGPWQIWVSDADGSNPRQVSFTDSAGTPRWSPDGRNIAFDGPGEGGSCIYVVRADGSGRTISVAEGLVPSYSRDGKWIYFASDRNDDFQVWKVPSSGGRPIQVTHQGGFAALEGLDGYLYYAKSRYPTPEVWRIPLAGGDEELVSAHVRPRTWSSWTVTRTGILFVEDLRDGKTSLSLYDPSKKMVRDLAPLQTAPFWMAATSDGKRAIINDSGERQITMVDNLQ